MNYDFFDCKMVIYGNRKSIIIEESESYPILDMAFTVEYALEIHFFPESQRVEAYRRNGEVWIIYDFDEIRGYDRTEQETE